MLLLSLLVSKLLFCLNRSRYSFTFGAISLFVLPKISFCFPLASHLIYPSPFWTLLCFLNLLPRCHICLDTDGFLSRILLLCLYSSVNNRDVFTLFAILPDYILLSCLQYYLFFFNCFLFGETFSNVCHSNVEFVLVQNADSFLLLVWAPGFPLNIPFLSFQFPRVFY